MIFFAARISAWIMIAISFRGFILWILNVVLASYMIVHITKIQNHNKVKSGFTNNGFIHDESRQRQSEFLGYDPL